MSSHQSFEQFVIETHGKSVYVIRLEIAASLFVAGDDPAACWQDADRFLAEMRNQYGFSQPD